MQSLWFCNWNEPSLNPLTSINWRASLVPAAAVIPAPIAYIKIFAVKKLVVGFLLTALSIHLLVYCWSFVGFLRPVSFGGPVRSCYFEKIRVFQAGFCLEYSSM